MLRAPVLALCALGLLGCNRTTSEPAPISSEVAGRSIADGSPPVVHRVENHSSALIAWRRARVRDRVLVHLDGQPDMDWLPDLTVARIAATHPLELAELELHPYAVGAMGLDHFGASNFIYPATRLGIVREVVWVVPDGTLGDAAAAAALVREVVLGRMQMISVDEARGFHRAGRTVQGTLWGVPVTICELADLPYFAEPVLLDIDLGYFTTRSALTQHVLDMPWITPEEVVGALARKGVRTDRVTISYSTMGGFLPPEHRWLGPALQARLRGEEVPQGRRRYDALRAEQSGELVQAALLYRDMTAADPDDASAWFALARVLSALGKPEAGDAMRRARALDPVLADAMLFAGDRAWWNGDVDLALARYRAWLTEHPRHPFALHAARRIAGCLLRLDRDEDALAAFEEVLRSAPGHADSRVELGLLLREHGRLPEAIAQLQAARESLPDLAQAAMALGQAYLEAGDTQLGVDELEVAVQRRPCWAMAHGQLAAGLARLGQVEDAREHLDVALTLQPANPQIRRIERQLRRSGVRTVVAGR
jgi:tetratricopeptide (TPR) repeat protein